MPFYRWVVVNMVLFESAKAEIVTVFLQIVRTLCLFLTPAERKCSRLCRADSSFKYDTGLFVQGLLKVSCMCDVVPTSVQLQQVQVHPKQLCSNIAWIQFNDLAPLCEVRAMQKAERIMGDCTTPSVFWSYSLLGCRTNRWKFWRISPAAVHTCTSVCWGGVPGASADSAEVLAHNAKD